MKKTILLAIILWTSGPYWAQAQTSFDNRVTLEIGNFYVPSAGEEEKSRFFNPILRSFGVGVSHNVAKRLCLEASFVQWYTWAKLSNFSPADGNGYYYDNHTEVGKMKSRYDYKFLEASIRYAFWQNVHHVLYAGAGISYAFGKNDIVESVFQLPGYEDLVMTTRTEKARYLGELANIGYRYVFFDGRIDAGITGGLRHFEAQPLQYYSSLSVGYRFRVAP